jgi:hypothetical protein
MNRLWRGLPSIRFLVPREVRQIQFSVPQEVANYRTLFFSDGMISRRSTSGGHCHWRHNGNSIVLTSRVIRFVHFTMLSILRETCYMNQARDAWPVPVSCAQNVASQLFMVCCVILGLAIFVARTFSVFRTVRPSTPPVPTASVTVDVIRIVRHVPLFWRWQTSRVLSFRGDPGMKEREGGRYSREWWFCMCAKRLTISAKLPNGRPDSMPSSIGQCA